MGTTITNPTSSAGPVDVAALRAAGRSGIEAYPGGRSALQRQLVTLIVAGDDGPLMEWSLALDANSDTRAMKRDARDLVLACGFNPVTDEALIQLAQNGYALWELREALWAEEKWPDHWRHAFADWV